MFVTSAPGIAIAQTFETCGPAGNRYDQGLRPMPLEMTGDHVSIAQLERSALVETIRAAGPEAPTLCEGWKTRDLAAHLVIREYRPDAAPGILIPFFARHTEKVQNEVAERNGWDELVDKVASGPPA